MNAQTLIKWHSGNGICHMNKVKLHRAWSLVSTGIGDKLWQVYRPSIYPGHSGPLSPAIPPWVIRCVPEMVSAIFGKQGRP